MDVLSEKKGIFQCGGTYLFMEYGGMTVAFQESGLGAVPSLCGCHQCQLHWTIPVTLM